MQIIEIPAWAICSVTNALKPRLRRLVTATLVSALSCTAHAVDTPSSSTTARIEVEARVQRIYETRLYLADRARLERVAFAIQRAASPYCLQNRGWSLGAPPIASQDLPEDLRKGFLEALDTNATPYPVFLDVPTFSPFRQAGARAGDRLQALTDTATGKTMHASWVLNRPGNTLAENRSFVLTLVSAEKVQTVRAKAQLICKEVPYLLRNDALIAEVSNGAMSVSTGMLRFIGNDDELALVLAHGVAHSIFALAGGPAAALKSGDKAELQYPATEERAADYLGAYIAVLAGFDGERASDIWRRLASNLTSKTNGGLAQRHPFSAERTLWQSATLGEIRNKRLNGLQLLPDRKSLPANLGLGIAVSDAPLAVDAEKPASDVDPRLYRVADVPFIDNAGRTGYQRFLNTPLRPRAFAIGPGSTKWSYRSGSNAAAEALRTCSTLAVPCALYAVDDAVVWDPETATHSPQPALDNTTDPRLNRVQDVPLLDAAGRVGYERFLNTSRRPRAFAIGPNGSDLAAWSSKIGANASADALAHCLVLSRGRPCYLYAVDDRVVWALQGAPSAALSPTNTDGADSGDMRLRPNASGFADVKDLAAVPLPQDQLTTYRAFLEKPAPRAFLVTREGFGRYWLGAAAMEDALSYCERLGEACWLYAVDDDVVWQQDVTKRISRRAQLPKQSDESQFLK
ncbi:MAG TPA: hypothetical protein VLC92_17480 [Rhodocyclaceae bacterium]|nr:hypothetical protein [Rhodocyclaceae bacterium]